MVFTGVADVVARASAKVDARTCARGARVCARIHFRDQPSDTRIRPCAAHVAVQGLKPLGLSLYTAIPAACGVPEVSRMDAPTPRHVGARGVCAQSVVCADMRVCVRACARTNIW